MTRITGKRFDLDVLGRERLLCAFYKGLESSSFRFPISHEGKFVVVRKVR